MTRIRSYLRGAAFTLFHTAITLYAAFLMFYNDLGKTRCALFLLALFAPVILMFGTKRKEWRRIFWISLSFTVIILIPFLAFWSLMYLGFHKRIG